MVISIAIVQLQCCVKQTLTIRLHYQPLPNMLDFRDTIKFQGNGGDKFPTKSRRAEELATSFMWRIGKKGLAFKNLGGFKAKWLVA